ncbi:MAG: polysaccharide biosynthesis/export family protein [Flavobacterium sp.]|uniref:polysaccharide biosynthesis/export family protein n=1 Tax=Flavobacterium sp. TaxID=239 RepID=UPI003BA75479
MNTFKWMTAFVLFTFLSSCVPTKDLIYLQDKGNTNDTATINEILKKPYRVQVNDLLYINIKTIDPQLTALFQQVENNMQQIQNEQNIFFQGFNVDNHGFIRIPVLGELNVMGLTVDEIRSKIENKLLEEYFNKEVNLFVSVKIAGIRYTINGEVVLPGTKILYTERATILDAVANAGDITITGDRKNVMVMRQFPSGIEMHTIDLTDKNVINSPYFYLLPNDYILVNPLKQKSWGTGTTGLQSLTTVISVLTLVATLLVLTQR